MLKFLGETLGANPTTTLTTTDKTLVGSINEVDAKVDSKIHISTTEPTAGDGVDGDIWLVYEE
jgi:hypothetical protein